MDLEYTIVETIHRNRGGNIVQLDFEFDETTVVESNPRSTYGITRQNKQKQSRTYDASITRRQYEELTHRSSSALSFDQFVNVLRPFIMGFYASGDLEKAFHTLDRDHSGLIHINELGAFLPILNDSVTVDALRDYIRKVDENFDGHMNYEEFRALVLRGIGRDIICNHI